MSTDFTACLNEAARQFPGIPALHFKSADLLAIRDWTHQRQLTPHNPDDRITFNWSRQVSSAADQPDSDFVIAMYAGQHLFGLTAGSIVSYEGEQIVRISLIEGARDRPDYLKGKVLPCAMQVAETIAQAHDISLVQIDKPNRITIERGLYAAYPDYKFTGCDMNCNFFEKKLAPVRQPLAQARPSAAPPVPP